LDIGVSLPVVMQKYCAWHVCRNTSYITPVIASGGVRIS
jgi:hypothetical protein